MKTADAHCDTIFAFKDNPFYTENAHWNIPKFRESGGILQFMDICVEPPHHGDVALSMAVNAFGNFHKKKPDEIQLLEKATDFDESKINIVLSIEGASPIIDDLNNLYAFYKLGLRAMTLTWNHRNFIGDGIGVGGNYGLTDFGKEVIREMERLGIIVDVSHLNEGGFKNLCEIAKKPFAATHSNAYSIHNHPRNLKDYQIKEIVDRKGFIGLNFYSPFINDSKDKDILLMKFLRHVEYYLERGAENVLGIGADFDGMDESPFDDARCYPEVSRMLLEELNLNPALVEKIMYKNLLDFTLKMI